MAPYHGVHDLFQVHWTIGLVTAFYTLVMTLGYTYGVCTDGVSDNILNNFGVDDVLMNTGRVGLSVTILVSFPLLTVPLIGTLVRAHREISSECRCRGVPTLYSGIRRYQCWCFIVVRSSGERVLLVLTCAIDSRLCSRDRRVLWATQGTQGAYSFTRYTARKSLASRVSYLSARDLDLRTCAGWSHALSARSASTFVLFEEQSW